MSNYLQGFLLLLFVYLICLILALFLPGKVVNGYCLNERGKNEVLVYKINGWRVYFVTISLLVFCF